MIFKNILNINKDFFLPKGGGQKISIKISSNGKNFKDLSKEQQTVIASVGFNHGVSFTRKDGSQMDFIKQAADNDWTAMIANLRDFGDNEILKPRRLLEADYLEDSLSVKPSIDSVP